VKSLKRLISTKKRPASTVFLILLITLTLAIPSAAPAQGQAETVRRVNAPFFSGTVDFNQAAIFWFGRVTSIENYADVRVGYNPVNLYIRLDIFDRYLWYDTTPAASELASWDAVSLYINRDGNTGATPSTNAYRLVAQLNKYEDRANYQVAYRGNGSAWSQEPLSFSTLSTWRGNNPNDRTDDRGWGVTFRIPFASLGLSGPPSAGTIWGLALQLHDRDDAAGTSIPVKLWPEAMTGTQPSTWGQIHFGLPTYTPPPSQPGGTVTIRQGLNGASVPDAGVGGTIGNLCPGDANFIWNQWGSANFAGAPGVNIQSQGTNIADWPCFAKYYLTFPLTALPTGKSIQSATLTLHQWGGSDPGLALPSLLQALTVADSWNENTLTWNNAPLAQENVAQVWADVVEDCGVIGGTPWPCVARQFDVSRAVAQAYAAGTPLRLAVYEADLEAHSGKYFTTSDEADWNAVGRPTLSVVWGETFPPLTKSAQPIRVNSGGEVTYTLRWSGNGEALTLVDQLPAGLSAPSGLNASTGAVQYTPASRQVSWSGSPAAGQTVTLSYTVTAQESGPLALTNTAQLSGAGGSSSASALIIVDGFESYLPFVRR
jgi:hypothetical protein